MISADDITAFQNRWGDAMEAATEYARRKDKGLPTDRWADGAHGEHMVALGIKAWQRICEMQSDAILAMIEAQRQAGMEAMEPSSDPMRARPRPDGNYGQGGTG